MLLIGADPNTQEGSEALANTITPSSCDEPIKILLALGANPVILDAMKRSPSFRAVPAGRVDMIIVILSFVSNVNQLFKNGTSALSVEVSLDHSQIAAVLIQKGRNQNCLSLQPSTLRGQR